MFHLTILLFSLLAWKECVYSLTSTVTPYYFSQDELIDEQKRPTGSELDILSQYTKEDYDMYMYYITKNFLRHLREDKLPKRYSMKAVAHGKNISNDSFEHHKNDSITSRSHHIDDRNPKEKQYAYNTQLVACHDHRSCRSCVTPCTWCHRYGCVDNPLQYCPEAQYEKLRSHQSIACSSIEHEGPILILAGIRKTIEVALHIIDPAVLFDPDVICVIQIDGQTTHLKGRIVNDIVKCYPMTIETKGKVLFGNFSLLWHGIEKYSNALKLISYSCEDMAKDCSRCLLIPAEYGCGWCEKTKTCDMRERCTSILKWGLGRQSCNNLI